MNIPPELIHFDQIEDSNIASINIDFPLEIPRNSFGVCTCPNILIVDDEPFNLIILKGILS